MLFQKLPPCSDLEQASIDVDRKRLKAQQLVVTKRVFGQILSAQAACLGEMERVEDIRGRLSGCIQVLISDAGCPRRIGGKIQGGASGLG